MLVKTKNINTSFIELDIDAVIHSLLLGNFVNSMTHSLKHKVQGLYTDKDPFVCNDYLILLNI